MPGHVEPGKKTLVADIATPYRRGIDGMARWKYDVVDLAPDLDRKAFRRVFDLVPETVEARRRRLGDAWTALNEVSAAAGIVSTVADLARFDIALDTGKLISAESRERLFTATRSNAGQVLKPVMQTDEGMVEITREEFERIEGDARKVVLTAEEEHQAAPRGAERDRQADASRPPAQGPPPAGRALRHSEVPLPCRSFPSHRVPEPGRPDGACERARALWGLPWPRARGSPPDLGEPGPGARLDEPGRQACDLHRGGGKGGGPPARDPGGFHTCGPDSEPDREKRAGGRERPWDAVAHGLVRLGFRLKEARRLVETAVAGLDEAS